MKDVNTILIIEDNADEIRMLSDILGNEGYRNIHLCEDSRDALSIIEVNKIDIIILDLFMPHVPGKELIEQFVEKNPEIPVIVTTGSDQVYDAIECLKKGVYDYFIKPLDFSKLLISIKNALNQKSLESEINTIREAILNRDRTRNPAFSEFISISKKMDSVFQYIEIIAASPRSVLICGESGTGKELLANAIHKLSGRSGDFVPVNIAGLDRELFNDTIFGHTKGAFTGADYDKNGLISAAANGTLFLDEIGDLENDMQKKLLRLLQDGEYYPVGGNTRKQSSARIICATNSDLAEKIKTGRFRNDLYFRLQTHTVFIPPLRDRKEDIPVLTEYLVDKACRSLKTSKPIINPEIYGILKNHDFPGNVRELEAILYDCTAQSRNGHIRKEMLSDYIGSRNSTGKTKDINNSRSQPGSLSYSGIFPKLSEAEEFLINEAMKECGGRQNQAAALLGIQPSSLCRKLKRMNDS